MIQESATEFDINSIHLNETGKRRVERGLTCFLHPEDGGIAAICVDYGLSARGTTAAEARLELENVLRAALETALDQGFIEEYLNQPDNATAARQLRNWSLFLRLVAWISTPSRKLHDVLSALFGKYEERLPHAFA